MDKLEKKKWGKGMGHICGDFSKMRTPTLEIDVQHKGLSFFFVTVSLPSLKPGRKDREGRERESLDPWV